MKVLINKINGNIFFKSKKKCDDCGEKECMCDKTKQDKVFKVKKEIKKRKIQKKIKE